MKYSLEELQNNFSRKEKLKYLFFWGHQPSKDGSLTKSCFGQWWNCSFKVDGVDYRSAEQYMMAEKAKLFGDSEARDKILQSKHPKQAKELGRMVLGFQDDVWTEKRSEIVVDGNRAKFLQNEDLKEFLIQTRNRILVEASPVDKIWGIGLAEDDLNIENPLKWKGLNLLGFALMEVRDELIK